MSDDSDIIINVTEDEWPWLKERKADKWKDIWDQFTLKMSIYMIQRIEKAAPKQYVVNFRK